MVVVLESIFTFNLSIPLNYLLEGFENRVLVIQVKSLHSTANCDFALHDHEVSSFSHPSFYITFVLLSGKERSTLQLTNDIGLA